MKNVNKLDQKTAKILKTTETVRPSFGAKFSITIPDEEGTTEFGNFIEMLGEIKRDNPDYVITMCEVCDNCGVINDTVAEKEVTDIDGLVAKKKLCDYCERGYEQ
jgi:hypothetical protein